MLPAALLMLGACNAFSVAKLDLEGPPVVLMTPGPELSSDPGRALSQSEVEIYWGRDRQAARVSQERHRALIVWVSETLAEVKGKPF